MGNSESKRGARRKNTRHVKAWAKECLERHMNMSPRARDEYLECLKKMPPKAREEYEHVNEKLFKQYDDWRRAQSDSGYDIRLSSAYADLDSCFDHAYCAALWLFGACWDNEKKKLRFPDRAREDRAVNCGPLSFAYTNTKECADRWEAYLAALIPYDVQDEGELMGKRFNRAAMGISAACDADFISVLIKNGDWKYLKIVLDDINNRAHEKGDDWGADENAVVRLFASINATSDKLSRVLIPRGSGGRNSNDERNGVIRSVFNELDCMYGPQAKAEHNRSYGSDDRPNVVFLEWDRNEKQELSPRQQTAT